MRKSFIASLRAQPHPRCHRPRRRTIQYSTDCGVTRRSRGLLDSPPSRGMTSVDAAFISAQTSRANAYCTSICRPSFWMMPANFFVSASTKAENCSGVL
ncbi:hypothetical protein F8237_30755 [Bradyrhizobium betae]|uniref:Uncharacterized protein n=1 Tax=Bradyrhizobium betae TaxID=244734 RepID=A0A5P6PDN8_9BRAD|nr:hypothetical protein F8237_30755 [Bradyrhizobium betae]